MADEEMSRSILEEYSIAELNGDLSVEQWGSLKDAFSRYAKVIFHDVADSYATDADILCCFTLSSDMQRKDGDLVALFRLGWRHSNEMITSQLVPQPSNPVSHDYEVLFKASDLPKNEGEIYQLCYISQNEVWGASVPFEFRRASAEELLVVDNGDIVIVRSQPAVAEDLKRQLAEIRKEKLTAENNVAEIQGKLTQAEEQNKLLHARLNDLEKIEQVLDRLRSENQALDQARNKSEEALRKAELQIVSLINSLEASQQDVVNLKNQLSVNIEAYERKNKTSQEHRSSQEMIDALRQGKDVAVREMRAAMAENERLQSDLAKVTMEKESLLLQVDALNKSHQTLKEEREQCEVPLKKRIEELLAELTLLSSDSLHTNNSNHEIEVKVDTEKIALQKDLENVTTRSTEVKTQIESLLTEMSNLKKVEASLQESHTHLETRVASLREMMREALMDENHTEAELHRRDESVASEKLNEKWVCILSAQARQQELKYELQEMQQELLVLYQQETLAKEALSGITNNSNDDAGSSTDSNSTHASKDMKQASQTKKTASDRSIEFEVVELRQRLQQAAEAYKKLYQQKLQVENQLLCMLKSEKKSDNVPK